MLKVHNKWMERAIFLAEKGLGKTKSNPLVGAVVVKDGNIIGEGFHAEFGGPHAEVEALKNIPTNLSIGASIYVSLEPCNHFGKTPPCTNLIIEKGIKKVYIGNKDPHSLVNGKGIEKLIHNDIEVSCGLMEKECFEMNRRFMTRVMKSRPYIILKWAQSHNGIMGTGVQNDALKGKISNERTLAYTHKWRSEEQAILIGCNTVINDNPLLNVRYWIGENPIIIIIDPHGKINPDNYRLFKDKNADEVIIFSKMENANPSNKFQWLIEDNSFGLDIILKKLADHGINSIMVEGGSTTLQHFIDESLWDEIRYFTSSEILNGRIIAPTLKKMKLINENYIGDNLLRQLHPAT